MKQIDYPLKSTLDIVSTCITLHKICILSKDGFDQNG